jgi:DNA-binding transcriptional LysR family regulator
MELDQLKGFYYAAKLQSFTETASRLYVTQSAISHQIKALEAEIGEPLLLRVGRRVRLTATGEMLFGPIEALLDRLDALETTVKELRSLERGRLRLGASDTASIYFLPELLRRFRAAHPGVEVSISSLVSPQVVRKVLEREVDLGIVSLGPLPECLDAVPLYRESLVCLAPGGHPFGDRPFVTAADLASEALILLEPGSVTRRRIDEHFTAAEARLAPTLELSNFEIIKRYVAAGLGISIAPRVVLGDGAQELLAIPLHPGIELEGGLVFRRDRKLARTALAFLELARSHFPRVGSSCCRPDSGAGRS